MGLIIPIFRMKTLRLREIVTCPSHMAHDMGLVLDCQASLP